MKTQIVSLNTEKVLHEVNLQHAFVHLSPNDEFKTLNGKRYQVQYSSLELVTEMNGATPYTATVMRIYVM